MRPCILKRDAKWRPSVHKRFSFTPQLLTKLCQMTHTFVLACDAGALLRYLVMMNIVFFSFKEGET